MKINKLLLVLCLTTLVGCANNNTATKGNSPQQESGMAKASDAEKDKELLQLARYQFDDLRDDDKDGVINQRDLCDTTPEHTKVDNDGCAFWTDVQNISWFPIKFKFDSSAILDETRIELIKAIEILQQNPQVRLVLIGDTSSEGSLEYNAALAERREQAVKGYLMREGGIEGERIETQTFNQQTAFTSHLKERKRRTIAVFIDKDKVFDKEWNIYTTDSENK